MKYLLGTRQAEIRAQRLIQSQIQAKFQSAFAAEIQAASFEMLDRYEATGNVPDLPVSHRANMAELEYHIVNASVTAIGNRILAQGKATGALERKEGFTELFLRMVQEYIEQEAIRRRITYISDTTRRQIIDMVAAGQTDGLGVAEIGKLIRGKVPGISVYRANLIARTETHGASNYGADKAARATGLDLQKEWVSVEDPRTRDMGEGDGVVDEYDHRSMNGQTVAMDQQFSMPWKKGDPIKCMHPGDVTLPAAASINCRCGVAHIVND